MGEDTLKINRIRAIFGGSIYLADLVICILVELPDSSEEYGDSMEIDPAAAASTAVHIAEFASASAGVLEAGTSEGPITGRSSRLGPPRSFSARSKRRRRPGTRR